VLEAFAAVEAPAASPIHANGSWTWCSRPPHGKICDAAAGCAFRLVLGYNFLKVRLLHRAGKESAQFMDLY